MNLFKHFVLVFVFSLSALAFPPLKTQPLFPVTPMLTKYIGETSPGHEVPVSKGVEKILYLNAIQREQFRVVIVDGIAIKFDDTIYRMIEPLANYVLDAYGNLYFFENEVRKELRHSSILSGAPVAAAGEVTLDPSGRIVSVNRSSGHYKPSSEFFNAMIKVLKDGGVDMKHLVVGDIKK